VLAWAWLDNLDAAVTVTAVQHHLPSLLWALLLLLLLRYPLPLLQIPTRCIRVSTCTLLPLLLLLLLVGVVIKGPRHPIS
jgi:hypothetical protein